MKRQTLESIEELLCHELEEYGEKKEINGIGELQVLDTSLHAMKNLYKIMDSMEGESSYGMSGENSYYSRRGGSYRGGSYRGYSREGGSYADGSYRGYSRDEGSYDDGGSYRRGRDRMTGRFVSRSSGSDMVDRLKDMMEETEDPTEKKDLRNFISSIEHRG